MSKDLTIFDVIRAFNTQQEVADYLGIDKSAVSHWIKRFGGIIPRKHRAKLAKKMGVKYEDFADAA